ncbi:MAG TPA: hypothetical protein DIW17_03980 [Clostridiales bacterium]|nr:hypothetical protein [Clostridiales bacterium]
MAKGRSYDDEVLDEKKLEIDEKIIEESSKRLKGLISASGKSIDTIAKELKSAHTPISYSTLYKYQATGVSTPYGLAVLAKYFDTTTDYLLGLSDVQSLDTSIQGVEKVTGLSEKAIEAVRYFNGCNTKSFRARGFAITTNYMGKKILNSFLKHPKLGEFIYNIAAAIYYSEFEIPDSATGKDGKDVEDAAELIGGHVLFKDDVSKFFRQEAIIALMKIVLDLVPEEGDHGNNSKER